MLAESREEEEKEEDRQLQSVMRFTQTQNGLWITLHYSSRVNAGLNSFQFLGKGDKAWSFQDFAC